VTVTDCLRRSEPFAALSADTLAEIAGICREIKFSKGQYVFRIGDPSKDLFILADGVVDLGFGEMSAEEATAGAIREPGDVLGGGALVGETNYRMINARCIQETRLVTLDGVALMNLLEKRSAIGFAFLRKLLGIIFNRVVSIAAT
jgi:toluene monooxygenase system ferredoxin subunit